MTDKAVVIKTFRTKLAESQDVRQSVMHTAQRCAIKAQDVVSVIHEAVQQKRRKLDEFEMHTPASAKGMFAGDDTADLNKRRSRDKAAIATDDAKGEGHAEKTKDLHRVDFALRAKHKGPSKWHKKV